jgi:hypothetical protein
MTFGPPQPPPFKKKPRSRLDREGWYRKGIIEDREPKWLVVAQRAGVPITVALCVKNYLQSEAAKARKEGHIGSFTAADCAAWLQVAETEVLSVIRVLVDEGWLNRDWVIVEWTADQPEKEDHGAAERQRRKRFLDAARIRIMSGLGTDDDLALFSKREQQQLAHLASLSRVTATPAPEPAAERIELFSPIVAKEDTHPAREIARAETDRAARRWLLGDGAQLVSYGHAAAIISQNYGCNRMSADAMVRRWLTECLQEAAMLANVISGAYEQGLSGENFQGVVEQRINVLIEERTNGPQLPLRPTIQRGGKRA